MILKNAMVTPDGTEIESLHRHDCVFHEDKNGNTYFVDGGQDYLRRSHHGDEKDFSVMWDGDVPHNLIREVVKWGTRGKDGDQPLKYKKLRDMDDDHIEAILQTQIHISHFMRGILHMELAYRAEMNES